MQRETSGLSAMSTSSSSGNNNNNAPPLGGSAGTSSTSSLPMHSTAAPPPQPHHTHMMKPPQRHSSLSSQSSSTRFESFTEAVPLSLSSMAHASLPLEDGVLDGVKQVLSHTLLSCVNYARIVHPPHQWTFRDLRTSETAWLPVPAASSQHNPQRNNTTAPPPRDLPFSLAKLKFAHKYTRAACIYLKPALPPPGSPDVAAEWPQHIGILGCIKLHYTSQEPLTAGELNGTETDDVPPTILYKVVVEYRSLPATGNPQAVQAEELSMLSFGGSVDDDVKYGALAALYDDFAKYVLEIYSVRGKKYKFDLMDATLSNGQVPRLPSAAAAQQQQQSSNNAQQHPPQPPPQEDPFVKSLCVTVTDHHASPQAATAEDDQSSTYAITRMHLTLEGKMRRPLTELPPMDFLAQSIAMSFRCLHPQHEDERAATALPSGHTLLLEPALRGQVYVNGRFVTSWGDDPRIGSHGTCLFGMDLHSIPVWHGRVVDYEALKVAYGQLWHELLIDARLQPLHIATRLLNRLLTGKDGKLPRTGDNDDEEEEEEEEDEDEMEVVHNIHEDCLETQCLATPKYDVVGIAAKALATRFALQFGKHAFPCLAHEVEWTKQMLPHKQPVIVVPLRLLAILRRGGYFDVPKTHDDYQWYGIPGAMRPAQTDAERALIANALQFLQHATTCDDDVVTPAQVGFTRMTHELTPTVIADRSVCRYHVERRQYCIHEGFLTASLQDLLPPTTNEAADADAPQLRAYLLGMYMAQVHPDGTVLPRYLLRNQRPSVAAPAASSPAAAITTTTPDTTKEAK